MSVNKVILIGNLGKKPELRYTPGGQAVANFTLATNERFGGRDGQPAQERTEWHRIVVWGRTAENCGQYLDKGRSVYIEGRLQTRKYTDMEGVEKYSTEIVGDRMQLLGGGRDAGGGEAEFGSAAPAAASGGGARRESAGAPKAGGGAKKNVDDFDDDIPF